MSLPWNEFLKKLVIIILCAGEGRRMEEISKKIPKPLLKIPSLNDKSILQNILEHLDTIGIKDIFIVKGHLGHLIDEHLLSYQKRITIIDSGEEYKKGPLNSFMEVLKSQPFQNKMRLHDNKCLILVIPGDTIFELNLLQEILEQIKKRQSESNNNPSIFYKNIEPNFLSKQKNQELVKAAKKISIAITQGNKSNKILKKIIQVDFDKINQVSSNNQVIPLLIFPGTFVKIILNLNPQIQERTLRALLNEVIKRNMIINALMVPKEYEFHDIDEITDLDKFNQ